MRLFTGLAIPPDVTETLQNLVARLTPVQGVRFSPPDKLHITTAFIGEWPEERLGEMQAALAQVTAPGPIQVTVQRLGFLPTRRSPNAVCASVYPAAGQTASEAGNLLALHQNTKRALAELGVLLEDRAYWPHVTLARIRGRPNLGGLEREMAAFTEPFGTFQANAFYLYLSADGKYTKLQEFPLPVVG